MRTFLVHTVLFISVAALPSRLLAADYVQMLNSYVSMKLHLSHSNGQMVGAAWIRLKNNSGAPLTEIPFVLNPGLAVTKITAQNGIQLTNNAAVAEVTGYDYLDATVGTVKLPSPLAPDADTEIVIHYRGMLQAIDWAGIEGARETLNPDFTIIRAESFGYPVISQPNKASVEAAINQPAYYQTATLELPNGYSVAGNLAESEKTVVGNNVKWDVKANKPTTTMVLPIAHFETTTSNGIKVAFKDASLSNINTLTGEIKPRMTALENWLGNPNRALTITAIPEGFGHRIESGFVMLNPAGRGTTMNAEIDTSIAGLWGLSQHNAGAWDTGLKAVINSALNGNDKSIAQADAFTALTNAVAADKLIGKKPIADIENPQAKDAIGQLFFWVLYDRLGETEFKNLARMLRNELPNSAAGYRMLADVIAEEDTPKAAKKLAKNWLEKGKLAKDLKKAKSFADITKRY